MIKAISVVMILVIILCSLVDFAIDIKKRLESESNDSDVVNARKD